MTPSSPSFPPLQGTLPDAVESDLVVFAACDAHYARAFAAALAYSLEANSPGHCLHLHVINPTPGIEPGFATLAADLRTTRFTWSFEDAGIDPGSPEEAVRAYYASVRFCRAWEVMSAAPATYLVLDVDSVVRAPLDPLLDMAGDVSLRIEADAPEQMRHKAGAVLVHPTANGRTFLRSLAHALRAQIESGELPWFVDQILIGATLEAMSREAAGFVFHPLDPKWLDWEFAESSAVWTGKGPLKDGDNPFTAALAEYAGHNSRDRMLRRAWGPVRDRYRSLILVPRLDYPFKRADLVTPEMRAAFADGEAAQVRRYWRHFASQLGDVLERRGHEVFTLRRPNWEFTPQLADFYEADIVWVPHRQKVQWFGGRATPLFYMQQYARWLFTVDPAGWGATASVYGHDCWRDGDAEAGTFDEVHDLLIRRNESKFTQPDSIAIESLREQIGIGPAPYIFFPCQIPHDETLRFHADIGERAVVNVLAEWCNRNGVHLVLKEHPANRPSMAGLREAAPEGPFVHWADASVHDLIHGAAAVYTINSGVGFEALLHHAPVVTFGRAEYDVVTIKGDIDDLDDCWRRAQLPVPFLERRRFVDWLFRLWGVDLVSETVDDAFRRIASMAEQVHEARRARAA